MVGGMVGGLAGVVVVGRLETTLDVLSPPPHPFGPGVFFAFKVLGAGGDPPLLFCPLLLPNFYSQWLASGFFRQGYGQNPVFKLGFRFS